MVVCMGDEPSTMPDKRISTTRVCMAVKHRRRAIKPPEIVGGAGITYCLSR